MNDDCLIALVTLFFIVNQFVLMLRIIDIYRKEK